MADDNKDDSSDKTLDPTEKRLNDARKKGDVPSSKETGNMVVILALLAITALVLPYQSTKVVHALRILIEQAANFEISTGDPGLNRVGQIMSDFFLRLAIAIAPLFAVLFVGGAIGALVQGETVVALERIKPKISKLSPFAGVKRLFSANSVVEFIKSIIKVLAVGAMAIWVTAEAVQHIWATSGFVPEFLPGYLGGAAQKLLLAAAIFLVPVAIADILWRRFEWRKKQRMSKKDMQDEQKESDGSPELRGKRAQRRRELSQQRSITAVPLADVILTNPTHFSVALKYDPANDTAPICVAKGADAIAQRIREIAFENAIPLIENKPLTRILYDTVQIDQVVPVEHWEIVAEIIRFVFDLKIDGINPAAPQGSTLRSRPN